MYQIDYQHVKCIRTDIDSDRLWAETQSILKTHDLENLFQVAYSSPDGENRWRDTRPQLDYPDQDETLEMQKLTAESSAQYYEQIAKQSGIPAIKLRAGMPRLTENMYSEINQGLLGTYTAELMAQYPEFYRWRLLRSRSGQILNVHRDKPGFIRKAHGGAGDYYIQERIHIVIKTNPLCHMMFCDEMPEPDTKTTAHYYQFPKNTVWLFDTSVPHTAMNYSYEDRYHLTAVRNIPGENPFDKQPVYNHTDGVSNTWKDR